MCYNLPNYYKIRVEYVPSDIEGIRETDERFECIAEDQEDLLDGSGSGFGFGIRDIDFDFETEESANKVFKAFEKLKKVKIMKDLDIEIYFSEIDNYECYLDSGCEDCFYHGKEETDGERV